MWSSWRSASRYVCREVEKLARGESWSCIALHSRVASDVIIRATDHHDRVTYRRARTCRENTTDMLWTPGRGSTRVVSRRLVFRGGVHDRSGEFPPLWAAREQAVFPQPTPSNSMGTGMSIVCGLRALYTRGFLTRRIAIIYRGEFSFSASSLYRLLLHGDAMRILTRSTCATPITTIESLRSPYIRYRYREGMHCGRHEDVIV